MAVLRVDRPHVRAARRWATARSASLRPIDLDMLYTDARRTGPVAPDGADLPHRAAPVARAGPAVGADRPQPGGRRHAAAAASRGGDPADGRRRCWSCSTPPTTRTPTSGVYLWVLAATGCRRGEACALRWTDVDLDRGEVSDPPVDRAGRRRAAGEGHQDPPEPPPGDRRGDGGAAAPAPAPAAGAGAGARRAPGRRRAPVRRRRGPAVAARRVHQPVRPAAGAARARAGAAARPAPLRGDGARSTAGSRSRRSATRLGHSEMSTTLNLYTHAIPATDQRPPPTSATSSAGAPPPAPPNALTTLSDAAERQVQRAHICRFPYREPAGTVPRATRAWWTGRTRSGRVLRDPARSSGLVRHDDNTTSPSPSPSSRPPRSSASAAPPPTSSSAPATSPASASAAASSSPAPRSLLSSASSPTNSLTASKPRRKRRSPPSGHRTGSLSRARQTLEWKTPSEALDQALR